MHRRLRAWSPVVLDIVKRRLWHAKDVNSLVTVQTPKLYFVGHLFIYMNWEQLSRQIIASVIQTSGVIFSESRVADLSAHIMLNLPPEAHSFRFPK